MTLNMDGKKFSNNFFEHFGPEVQPPPPPPPSQGTLVSNKMKWSH